MDNSEKENLLKNIYYNPAHPAGFSTAEKLSKHVDVPLFFIKNWLSKQNTFTLHKQRRKKFKRNKIVVSRVNEQFQADIVDMQAFSRKNNGYKYILTAIDVFSKFGFALKLKSKNANDVIKSFEFIFSVRKPQYLQTDNGKEFVNKYFKKFLEKNNVVFFTSNNQTIKCSIVERFNRTLKSKMWKYFTSKGTRRWVDVLDKFVNAYNNTVNRVTRKRPSDINFENSNEVFKNLYGFNSERELLKSIKRKKFNPSFVRIPYEVGPLHKGYYPLWKDQLFEIENVMNKFPRELIKVKDQLGNKLKQSFYPEEIQKVKENVYRIEKILKKRTVNGQKEVLVKWLGYSDSYNSWEPEKNIEKLNGSA